MPLRSPQGGWPHVDGDALRLGGRQIAAAILVCTAPLVLLLFSTDWIFTHVGYIDPWYYVGFFHFYDVPEYLPGAYKLARLPWILAGWLVNLVLPTVAAAIVLHAAFLVAATTAMFTLAWLLFGSYEVALVGALILGFHPAWHGSGGWDYHNTAAGAFYLWSLVAVTVAARRGTLFLDALAGAAVILAVHCNITYGAFLPIVGAHYLVVSRISSGWWPPVRRIAMTIAVATTGAVMVTAALAAINALVGRDPWFFLPLLQITLHYTQDTSNLAQWWYPWSSGWFWVRYHLALPMGMLALSPLIWWFASRTANRALRSTQQLVVAEFVVMACVWSAWHFAGNLTLEWDYFFFPLLPHVLLALVALISVRMEGMPSGWVAANAVLLLGTLGLGFATWFATHQPAALARVPIVAPTVLFVVAGACTALPRPWRTAAFTLVFSAANALSGGLPVEYSAWLPCHIRAATYRAVVATAKVIHARDATMRDARIWFDEEDSIRTASGCAIYLKDFGYSLSGTGVQYVVNPFPMPPAERIPADVFHDLAQNRLTVVIPSTSTAVVQRFLRAASAAGAGGVVSDTLLFRLGAAEIGVTSIQMGIER